MAMTLQRMSPPSHLWVTVMITGEKQYIVSTGSLLPFNSPTSIFKTSTSSEKNNLRAGTVERGRGGRQSREGVGLACRTHLPHIQLCQQSWAHGLSEALRCCGLLHWISSCSCGVFTSPNAPLPITFKDSKSSNPSLVLFKRRNSVSFRAWADRLSRF